MSPWGLLLGLGLFLFSERAEGGTGRAEGKSVRIVVEGKDAGEALRVARASVAATDLFDELSGARRQPALNLRGKLVEGLGGVQGGEGWLEGDPKAEDFAAAWVAEVIQMRIVDLGSESSGSEPTVVRFCRGMGFAGPRRCWCQPNPRPRPSNPANAKTRAKDFA